MKNPEYRQLAAACVIPAYAVSRLIWAETNLDSRVRGNDQSRKPPFSFSVGEPKIMNHFVVNRIFECDDIYNVKVWEVN